MLKALRFSMFSIGLLMVLLWQAGVAQASCGAWSVIASPNPPGDDTLFAVAAISSNNVWAVGSANQGSFPQPSLTLIEHWNGTSWSVVSSPSPGVGGNKLLAVTVVSVSNVWAVGYFLDSNNVRHTLTEHFNGTSWSVVASPSPGSVDNELLSVAAVSANDIWAVGYFSTNTTSSRTLIEHFNGTSWKVVPSPNPGPVSGYNYLRGVTAISANNIWAVGNYSTVTGTSTLITHWTGTHWSVVASPNPGVNNALFAVTAISASNIWTVGSYSSSNGGSTLAEHYNGISWKVIASPNLAGSMFSGIAAVSANDIWAVGEEVTSPAGIGSGRNPLTSTPSPQTLIEQWNGSSWSVVASPNPGSGSDSLDGVAVVPATNQAWSVGAYNNGVPPVQTLTEFYC